MTVTITEAIAVQIVVATAVSDYCNHCWHLKKLNTVENYFEWHCPGFKFKTILSTVINISIFSWKWMVVCSIITNLTMLNWFNSQLKVAWVKP